MTMQTTWAEPYDHRNEAVEEIPGRLVLSKSMLAPAQAPGYAVAEAGHGSNALCSVWHPGQRQPLGTSSKAVPGGAPCAGSPTAGSYT